MPHGETCRRPRPRRGTPGASKGVRNDLAADDRGQPNRHGTSPRAAIERGPFANLSARRAFACTVSRTLPQSPRLSRRRRWKEPSRPCRKAEPRRPRRGGNNTRCRAAPPRRHRPLRPSRRPIRIRSGSCARKARPTHCGQVKQEHGARWSPGDGDRTGRRRNMGSFYRVRVPLANQQETNVSWPDSRHSLTCLVVTHNPSSIRKIGENGPGSPGGVAVRQDSKRPAHPIDVTWRTNEYGAPLHDQPHFWCQRWRQRLNGDRRQRIKITRPPAQRAGGEARFNAEPPRPPGTRRAR